MEQILANFPKCEAFFFRESTGREIDLILQLGDRRVGIEFKLGAAPGLARGIEGLIDELELCGLVLTAPVPAPYAPQPNIFVENLASALRRIGQLLDIPY